MASSLFLKRPYRLPFTSTTHRSLCFSKYTPDVPDVLLRSRPRFRQLPERFVSRRLDSLLSVFSRFIWSISTGSYPWTSFHMIRAATYGSLSNRPILYPMLETAVNASLFACFAFHKEHACSAVLLLVDANISGVRGNQNSLPVSGSYRRRAARYAWSGNDFFFIPSVWWRGELMSR